MKYKLIKEYPGSPKLGAIVVKGTNIKCRGLYMGMDNNKYYPVNDMTNEYGIAENKIEN